MTNNREIPIVHRVIKVHDRRVGVQQDVLTKGDNNYGDDKVLYADGQSWLHREHIMGRAVGYLPHVGRVTIIMNDYPYVKARTPLLVARQKGSALPACLLTLWHARSTCSSGCWGCWW
jgi:hypothetical protein